MKRHERYEREGLRVEAEQFAVLAAVPSSSVIDRDSTTRARGAAASHSHHDIDYAGLAGSFEMSGGYSTKAALRAAFLCAEEGSMITNASLWRAARSEYEAIEKSLIHVSTTRLVATALDGSKAASLCRAFENR